MSNTSTDNRLDPSSQQFDPAICRDYVRNACRRGQRCKFKHPPNEECEKMRRSERIFCHDYQNSTCRRPVCKFLHYSREEEDIFRITGCLPDIASVKVRQVLPNSQEQIPLCKDYINGICSRGATCKYRHTVNGERPDSLTPVLSWRDTLLGESECPASLKSSLVSNEPSPPTFVTVVPNSVKAESSLPIQASLSSIPQSLIPGHQPTILNAASVIVSASDSLLLKDVYVTNSSQASQPTVVGMLDHVTLSAQPSTLHHQHTIYAHAPTLTSFTHPLASVANPVLAVVAESTAPTGPGQHPAAVLQTGPQTATYHLLSTSTRTCNTSAGSLQPQHHLLPTGSSSTSCPTVFTIPLTRFACEAPATSATVLHHHHPQAVAVCSVPASVFSSGPHVSYPSYGIIQTDTGMNTNCTGTTMASCPTIMYPSSLESLVNCSDPAAATTTNFLTLQKQPGHTTPIENCTKPLGLPPNSESSTSTGSMLHHHELHLQQHPSPIITNRNSTMSVAASLPTVSVAAAAAVAAATAIARSSNISAAAVRAVAKHRKLKQTQSMDCNSPTNSFSSDNGSMVVVKNNRLVNAATALSQSGSLVGVGYNEATADGFSEPPPTKAHRVGACSDWKSTVASSITTTTTAAILASAVSSTATTPTTSSMLVKMPDDDVVDEDESVGTETAAAFAAAACIGAMFSNPISSRASNTTSVAAMLGDLISGGHHGQLFSDDLKMSIPATSVVPTGHSVAGGLTVASDPGTPPPGSVRVNSGGGSTSSPSDCNSTDVYQVKRMPVSNKSGFSHYRYVNYQKKGVHEEGDDDSTDWSDVPTSVASAAKAAAAAAVAATAAVTNSASGFFRRNLHDAKLKQAVTTSSQVTGSLKGLLSSTKLPSVSSSYLPPTSAAFSSLWKPAPRACGMVNSTSSGSPDSSYSSPLASPSAATAVTADEICDDIAAGSAEGVITNAGLSGLSPNTAATMTSAATAAAMVAAAATAAAAAKQRRFLSEPDSLVFSDTANSQYLTGNITQQSDYRGDGANYPVVGPTSVSFTHTPSAASAAAAASSSSKRRRRAMNRRFALSCYGGQTSFRGSLGNDDEEEEDEEEDDDEEEEEDDVFDEDDVDFASAAPPAYRRKRAKCLDKRISQFRPGSCETSPSEGFSEVEPWSYRQRGASAHALALTSTYEMQCSYKPGNILPSQHKRSAVLTERSPVRAAGPAAVLVERGEKPRPELHSRTRRAKSTGSLCERPATTHSSTSLFPSKSLPNLAIPCVAKYAASGCLSSTRTSQASKAPALNNLSSAVHKISPSRMMAKSAEIKALSGNAGQAEIHSRHTYSQLNKLSNQCIPRSDKHISSRSSTKKTESFSQKRLINCFMQRNGRFKKVRTSTENSMIGDASGTDDYCDDVDTEYYEEDFDSSSSRPRLRNRSLARSNTAQVPRLSSFRGIAQNHHDISSATDNCPRVSETDFHCSSPAVRQQAHALRVENARLRHKVCELVRQRGDLRAANEILLEQNARLRRSSKRASVVARMAESATKIIEAHNKATASQQMQHQQQQQAQSFHHPQQAAPNSVALTQAAAAAAAAVAAAHHHQQQQHHQHQSTFIPPSSASTSCVYVTSSPTPSSQASGSCVSSSILQPGGPHTAAMVSGATITIAPQHGSLATVQMQTPQPLPQGAETGHTGLNFYSHQVSHQLAPIPVSLATSVTLTPALSNMSAAGADSRAAIQVCHYPVASNSAAAVFPNLSQAPAQLVGSLGSPTVGVSATTAAVAPTAPPRNAAVTLVLGQPTPATFSPATLHLSADGVSGTVAAAAGPPYSYPHAAYASLAQATSQPPATSLLQPCKLEPVGVSTSLAGVPAGTAVMRLLPEQHRVVPSAIADQRRG